MTSSKRIRQTVQIDMIRKFTSGVLNGVAAGVCIALGGSVFLACDNKYIGAVLFCVALLSICSLGYSLFTGKIGGIVENHSKDDFIVLFSGLLGNFIATVCCGLLIAPAFSNFFQTAEAIVSSKLALSSYQVILKGVLCGILMYIAVEVYSKKKSPIGILFCIPVFILSGFEHSIADMFYFSVAGKFSLSAAVFILEVILGNSIGGMLLPCINKLRQKIA